MRFELLVGLIEMVQIKMHVAEGVDELSRLESRDLRHHERQQRVGGDVEGHAEKHVGRALVELAGEAALSDIELEQAVARRQRHLVELAHVPGADDMAARIGIALQAFDHVGDLIDMPPVGRGPGAPLPPIDRTELAVLVGPLVPDAHPVLVQIAHIGRALQEPEQLVHDRLHVQLLGGEEREAVLQVEAHLRAEQAEGAGAGAVPLGKPFIAKPGEEIEILTQR